MYAANPARLHLEHSVYQMCHAAPRTVGANGMPYLAEMDSTVTIGGQAITTGIPRLRVCHFALWRVPLGQDRRPGVETVSIHWSPTPFIITLGGVFSKSDVELSLRSGKQELSEEDALKLLRGLLYADSNELTPEQREFALEIARGRLRLTDIPEEQAVSAGLVFWYGRLIDLDNLLANDILSNTGLLEGFVDEFSSPPAGAVSRDAILEWYAKLFQVIRFLQTPYRRYAKQAGFSVDQLERLLRDVQKNTVEMLVPYDTGKAQIPNEYPPESESFAHLKKVAEQTAESLHKLRPELVECVERFRQRLEVFLRAS